MFKIIVYFLLSVLVATILTCVSSTQLILADVQSFGLDVSFTDRLISTGKDLIGLGPSLFILISPGFLIAFIIAKYASQFIGGNQKLWFMLAGFASFPTTLLIIKLFLGVTILASARTSTGLLIAGCCGLVGGYLFGLLCTKKEEMSNE
jgi:hypothetical protein